MFSRNLKAAGAALIVAGVAAACAPTQTDTDYSEQAQAATVAFLGEDVSAGSVQVSDVTRTVSSSSWRAETAAGVLNCTANEKFQLADCQVAVVQEASNVD
ncbi:MAG: hypothetical protein R3C52_03435 [Hyphomonadaceae bacterium]